MSSQEGRAEASLAAMREQRIRIAKSQADALEMKNCALAGRLLDAGEVETEWSGVLRTVRAGMLAVPSRCGSRLAHLTPRDLAEIDAEVARGVDRDRNDGGTA